MEKLAAGKFEVTLSGEAQNVVITFGLRSDILRLITKAQLEYRSLSAKSMLSTEMRAKLAELVEALDAERSKEEKDEARINELQTQVNKTYEESIKIIDDNKDKLIEQLALGSIDLTDNLIAEILATVLTKRNDKGEVVTKLTKDDILYGQQFINDGDELLQLIEAIMQYLTDSLKKIQVVNQMLTSLVKQD